MAELTIYQWLWSIVVVMGAAGVQEITGFGFALISIPLLLLIFPSYEAVLISIMLAMITLLLQGWKNVHQPRWDLIWRLIVIGLPGLWFGILIGKKMNVAHLEGFVGISVLSYVIAQLVQERRKRRLSRITNVSNDTDSTITRKLPKGFYLAGLSSGVLTGAVGLPGPPVIATLIPILKKDLFRATVLYYFIFIYAIVISVALFSFKQEFNQVKIITVVMIYIVPLLIGFYIGQLIQKQVNDVLFKHLVYSLLILVGTFSCWSWFAKLI
ncbi:sulfite exporter TauE/SafE family protein [Sutcliffiella horikoshii]|uniref:Probable membrane transporter protein n=1 Tax=Sutcliffiella horikoshii TaxID=79883 RepID=A0A5D4T5L3_9BACI|nr:sulfite exporter TauE/SafE family protein [Sutcliffiella horikoshii]TYS69762.1 sulfite exporter TauE/SafE family protein [Sutcliffiella horikoshii]